MIPTLRCPHCQAPAPLSTCVGVSAAPDHIRRTYAHACGATFATYERVTGSKTEADQRQLGRLLEQIEKMVHQARGVVQ